MSDMSGFQILGEALVPAEEKDPTQRPQPVTRRKAIINAIDLVNSKCTIDISGVLIPGCEFFLHYAPRIGDVVWVDVAGKKPIIMGLAGGPLSLTSSKWHLIGTAGEPFWQNGWGAYPSVAAPGFYRIGQIVYIHALVYKPDASAGNSTAFTLPVGYRPRSHYYMAGYNSTQWYVDSGGLLIPVNAASNFYPCIGQYVAEG